MVGAITSKSTRDIWDTLILKQKRLPLLNSDECNDLTKSAQGLMCIGGDKGKQTFLNDQ